MTPEGQAVRQKEAPNNLTEVKLSLVLPVLRTLELYYLLPSIPPLPCYRAPRDVVKISSTTSRLGFNFLLRIVLVSRQSLTVTISSALGVLCSEA
jgi:hypothetical protein